MAKRTYTTSEAAAEIGISRQTLQAWISGGMIPAPKPIEVGNLTVRLWAERDIERARKFKGTLKPGPRSKKRKT